MKKLIFILLFPPTLLFAQSDSIQYNFKIGDCHAAIEGQYYVASEQYPHYEVKIDDLLNHPFIELRGCGDSKKIVSYAMNITINRPGSSTFINYISNNDSSMTLDMFSALYMEQSDSWIMIQNVISKNSQGRIDTVESIALKIIGSGEEALLKNAKKFASIGGIIKNGTISFNSLKRHGKLEIQGGTTNDKIISFELRAPTDTLGEVDESKNEFFTPRMNYLVQTCKPGSEVQILNVHILSEGKECIIPGLQLTVSE